MLSFMSRWNDREYPQRLSTALKVAIVNRGVGWRTVVPVNRSAVARIGNGPSAEWLYSVPNGYGTYCI